MEGLLRVFPWRHRILYKLFRYAESGLAFLSYLIWSIYKRTETHWFCGPWKPQEAEVLIQGSEYFLPLTFIRCLQSFSEKDVQKKNHFCEILESFLVCLMISIVASIINSLQILLPFLITASIKIIPKYFNLLTQKAFRKVRNVIHINKVVNVIKYFWHLFLEVKLGLCLSILETMSKAANTVDWGKHHLRNS